MPTAAYTVPQINALPVQSLVPLVHFQDIVEASKHCLNLLNNGFVGPFFAVLYTSSFTSSPLADIVGVFD